MLLCSRNMRTGEIVMGKTSSQQSMGDAVVLALHVVAEFSAELGALFLCEGKKFPVCHDDIIIVHDILNVAEIDDAAAVGHVELRRIQLRIDGVQGVLNHVLCGCGVDNDTPLFGAEKITDLVHTLLDLSRLHLKRNRPGILRRNEPEKIPKRLENPCLRKGLFNEVKGVYLIGVAPVVRIAGDVDNGNLEECLPFAQFLCDFNAAHGAHFHIQKDQVIVLGCVQQCELTRET